MGYWIDSDDNPFNQMDYTRGGGGDNNRDTRHSNDRRAFSMEGAGASALPHFRDRATANAALVGKQFAVVGGDDVIRTTGPGSSSSKTKGGSAGSGSGASGVATGPRAGGSGAGSSLAISGPLEVGIKDSATGILTGGGWWHSNPWWSDTEEWEARYGEPGDWLGGVVVAGADLAFNVARGIDHATGSNIVEPARRDKPIQYGDGLTTIQRFGSDVGGAFARQGAMWDQQLNRAFGTGKVVPMGGF